MRRIKRIFAWGLLPFILASSVMVQGQSLTAPTGVAATTNLTGEVTISWASSPPAISYSVLRSKTNDLGTAMPIATGITGILSFGDTAWPPETKFWYWVEAHDAFGRTATSLPVEGKRRLVGFGQKLWTRSVGARDFPSFTPQGHVVVATTSGVAVLNQDGTILQNVDLGTNGFRPTIALNNSLLVAAGSNLFCLTLAGQTNWIYRAESAISASATLSLSNNVAIPLVNGRVALLTAEGELVWRKSVATSTLSRIAADPDGNVYVRSEQGDFVSLDVHGNTRWSVAVGERGTLAGGGIAPPVVSHVGLVYVLGGGAVHAFFADGRLAWRFPAAHWEVEPTVDAAGVCFFVTLPIGGTPQIEAVNPDGTRSNGGGTELHMQPPLFTTTGSSRALEYDGRICVGPDGTVFRSGGDVTAFRHQGRLVSVGWPGPGHDYRNTGRLKPQPVITSRFEEGKLNIRAGITVGEELLVEQTSDFVTWNVMSWTLPATEEVRFGVPADGKAVYFRFSSQ